MVELKEAMEIAKNFIIEVNGNQENFSLEEISLSPDKKSWEVIYSYDRNQIPRNEIQKVIGLDGLKTYKKVVIDSQTEEIIGMFNWSYDRRAA